MHPVERLGLLLAVLEEIFPPDDRDRVAGAGAVAGDDGDIEVSLLVTKGELRRLFALMEPTAPEVPAPRAPVSER